MFGLFNGSTNKLLEHVLLELRNQANMLSHLDAIGHIIMAKADDLRRELEESKTSNQQTKDLILQKLQEQNQQIDSLKSQLADGPANQEAIDQAVSELDQMQKDGEALQAQIRGDAQPTEEQPQPEQPAEGGEQPT